MIVSASYRTDIPAFYAKWFENRFREGFCMATNPYSKKPYKIPLRQGVDGFVFWTRNIAPFEDALAMVKKAGLPFIVQYTLTNYPKALERHTPDVEKSVRSMRRLKDCYGSEAAIWRYDPIILSDLTPREWHVRNFAALAQALEGAVNETIISYVEPYAKTRRNMALAEEMHHFSWQAPSLDEKTALTLELSQIAAQRGIKLALCAQPALIEKNAGKIASCIDSHRLARIAGHLIAARRKGNRKGCLCAESKDIGAYESCLQGCVYCYAVNSAAQAQANLARHDPDSPFLFTPPDIAKLSLDSPDPFLLFP